MCGSLVFLPLYFETNEIKYLQKITIGTSESIRTEEEYKLQMELEEEDEAVSKETWSGNWPSICHCVRSKLTCFVGFFFTSSINTFKSNGME